MYIEKDMLRLNFILRYKHCHLVYRDVAKLVDVPDLESGF